MPHITVAGRCPPGVTGILYLTKKLKTEALLPDINSSYSVEQVLPVGDDCNHPILIDVEAQLSISKPLSTNYWKTDECNI